MKKSIISKIISLILVTAMLVVLVKMPVAAAEENTTYISDVKIGYDDDNGAAGADRSKKALRDQGYTVVDKDLNSGTGEGWAYIGYKTTKNKDEAITDMRIMDMDGGYKLNNYYNVLSHYKGAITEKAQGLKVAAAEFKTNLAGGSKAAAWAYEKLNYLVVSTAGNMQLGEYLLSSDRVLDDYYSIVLKCDPAILTYILTQFTIAVSDYNGETWLQRFGKIDTSKVSFTDVDYFDRAKTILSVVQAFSDDCNEAYNALDSGEELTSEQRCNYTMVMSLYTTLNEETYDGVGIGDKLTSNPVYASDLYPLIYAMTPGQYQMLGMTGIELAISNLKLSSAEADKAYDSATEKIADQVKVIKGVDLWMNINENVVEDKEVAVTAAANRRMISQNKLDELARTDSYDQTVDSAFKLVGVALSISLLTLQISWKIMAASYAATFSFSTIFSTLAGVWCAGIGGMFASAIFAVGTLVLAVAIIALIAIAVYYIVQLFEDDPELTDIPTDMYDYLELPDEEDPTNTISKYIGYKVVTDQNGNAADLNAWKGNKWNALYYTKDTSAGSPLLAPSDGENISDYILVKYGESLTPEGFSPLSKFGENIAFNTNTHAYDDDCGGIYVFFKRSGNNAGVVTGEYISDMVVYEESSAEYVLAKMNVNGFTPIQYNLNSDSCDEVAMIGYKTTTKESNAIRDIRIVTNYNADQIILGTSSSYSNAGTYQSTTLLFSSGADAGDPILADFFVTHSLSETPPAGYEPISLLSGGPAVNMAIGSQLGLSRTGREQPYVKELYQLFIYFKTGVVYGDDAPEYVSGIAFFQSNNTDNAMDALTEYGYTYFNQDMTDKSDNKTLMGISTTKNPKRALTKVYTYFASDEDTVMPAIATNSGVSYTAAATFNVEKYTNFVTFGMHTRTNSTTKISISSKNAYISIEGNNAMYVTCAGSAGVPFTAEDIKLSSDRYSESEIPSGYYGVSSMMDSTYSATDIKRGNSSEEFLYMYLPGTKGTIGKYISSILIAGSEYGDTYSKLALLGLGADEVFSDSAGGRYYNLDKGIMVESFNISMGLAHINNINYAIRDIKIVPYKENEDKKNMPETIIINKITYTRCSAIPCGFNYDGTFDDGDWYTNYYGGAYVYVTSNPAAGDPITNIVMKEEKESWFMSGYETAAYYTGTDGATGIGDLNKIGDSHLAAMIYFKRTTQATSYIKDIHTATAKGEKTTWLNIALYGFNNYIDYDFNQDTGGNYAYIGYTKTNNSSEAITGFLLSVRTGNDNNATIEKNGITYYLAEGGTDFNSGAGGDYVYLYYTKDPKAGSPITELCGNQSETDSGWNTVLNTEGGYGNFNDGADYWFFEPDSLYMHFKRADNSVLPRTGSAFSTADVFIMSILTAVIAGSAVVSAIIIKKKRKQSGIV